MVTLNYPALIYNDKFIQGQLYNEKTLCRRTIESFNKKLYEGAVIIDSKGRSYKVMGV